MKLLRKASKIHITDLLSLFILLLAYPIGKIIKLVYNDVWLISERPNDARDNGYHLFKYLRENHSNRKVYYAINTMSSDYEKVKSYKNIIEFSSFKHYIYYFAASKNISTQIGSGEPNDKLCLNLEILGIVRNKKIFLQHGIIKDVINFALYKNCKVQLFICGAKPEFDFVSENFGYPEGSVKYLGLCRFDSLQSFKNNKRQILLMPTWRQWLNNIDEKFIESNFFEKYSELINNRALIKFLAEHEITLFFYLHDNLQKYSSLFQSTSEYIKIAHKANYDIQTLIKESALLVTDYSSVFFDFAYMRKPTIYYQFDIAEYRKGHYKEGYFVYEKDSFGPICYDCDQFVIELTKLYENKFNLSEIYLQKIDLYFPLYDSENCKRTFEAIDKL